MPASSVLPHALFKKLDLFSINTKRKVNSLSSGSRASFKKGHGIEFADYREYQPGDNIKHIDWNLYARSDRTYVKTFQEEQGLELLIIVDGSRSMFAADEQKWQYVRDLSLAISYVAFSEREKVTVKIIGTPKIGPLANVNSIRKIADWFDLKKPSLSGMNFEDLIKAEVIKTLEQVKYPSVCVLISDFLYEQSLISRVFKLISSKNLDLVVIQALGKKDQQPFDSTSSYQAVDSETGDEHIINFDRNAEKEYSSNLKLHCKNVAEIAKQSKANYALANTSQDMFEFLSTNLTKIGLLV